MKKIICGILAGLMAVSNGSAIALADVNISNAQIFTFVKQVNKNLMENGNEMWTLPNEQKVDIGIAVCKFLQAGGTKVEISKFMIDQTKNYELSRYQQALSRDYIVTLVAFAPLYLCPQYSDR